LRFLAWQEDDVIIAIDHKVRKRISFAMPFYTKNASFYQDRLGTFKHRENISSKRGTRFLILQAVGDDFTVELRTSELLGADYLITCKERGLATHFDCLRHGEPHSFEVVRQAAGCSLALPV
jgi:hypothetical protein